MEYPSLVTISRPKFIQIVDYDENREKAARDQKLIWTQERVGRQIGFRWIAEALAGGNLSNLSPGFFRAILMDPSTLTPIQDLTGFSERLKQQIKANRPILVGHNLFADLVYFCRCFFGPLPDKVEDFQAMAHELFPTLVDTKYLATHDCGSINPRSSLTEINASLARVAGPGISRDPALMYDIKLTVAGVHPHYGKYNAQEVAHEAGYDSLLTAKIFIKLSYQLREGGASKLPGALAPTYGHQQVPFVVSGPTSQPDVPAPYWNVNSTPHMPGPSGNPMYGYQNSTYGLCTQFGGLQVCSANAYGHRTPLQTSSYEMPANRGESIPPLGREFWKNYGNKLRVFGTEERVCDMGKPTHK